MELAPHSSNQRGEEKTPYSLTYHTDLVYNSDTVHHMTFLYAKDAEEARVKANAKMEKIIGRVHEIELKVHPHGFHLHHSRMEGKLTFNLDGTVKS